jgi:hypothetical protein
MSKIINKDLNSNVIGKPIANIQQYTNDVPFSPPADGFIDFSKYVNILRAIEI